MREKLLKIAKILTIIFMSLTFLAVFLPDGFVVGVLKLTFRANVFELLIRWFSYVSFLVLPIAIFFNRPTFKKIAIYFSLPVLIVRLFMFPQMLEMFTSDVVSGLVNMKILPEFVKEFMSNGVFRSLLFFAIAISELLVIGYIIYDDWKVLKFKKNEILPFILVLITSIFAIMPIYTLETLFNTRTDIIFERFSIYHLAWALFLVLEGVVLYLIFRKKSEEDRYILVLLMSLCLLIQYNQLFSTLNEITIERLPFMLCNVAAYITVISIAFKVRGLFIFNILVNVLGGIIAFIVCDVEKIGLFAFDNLHYITEHNNVILIPILSLALGVFKPIEKKDYKTFVIYFSVYFIIVFIFGTMFNAIGTALNDKEYYYCNYIYLFDPETAGELIPFTKVFYDVNFTIGDAIFYPIVQPAIYLIFIGIGTLTFFILKKKDVKKN